MGRVVSDEIMNLKIVINGDEAQARVLKLELANKDLAVQLGKVNAKQSEFRTAASKNSEEYRKNAAEIERLNREIADNKKAIDIEIHAMNNLSLTMEQLRKKAADLKFMMSHMAPGTKEFSEVQAELSKVNGRMGELNTGAAASSNSIGNLADKFNRYQGIALAVTATLAGVALSLQSVIDLNNKLADAQTTVSKTTGMNKQEVDELTKSFSEFNTRSSRMDLLKISEIGGRLGVPKEEIKDFTREVDKAYVALGDGFTGGVEAVANKLGKIKGLFKETKDMQIADAMNQVGSAMNELGAAGAASEENIAEFALRVGSLPDVLKPTISDALALGAAFEEGGIDAERSGTAYSNFISTAAKSTKAFAEVMRIPQQQVKDMINTDPTEFFLKFAEGLKGLDATEMATVLEHLKLNDQYVKSILGDASANTERYRKTMQLANEELTKATSLQMEFDKVNNNAAATYDKVRKKFLGMFTTDAVAKSLNFTIEVIGRLLGVNDEAEKKTSLLKESVVFLARVFLILATSIVSVSVVWAIYNNLIKESILRTTALEAIEKGRNLRMQISTTIQNLWNLSVGNGQKALGKFIGFLGFQTAATNLQTTAQERLNLVTKANPWMAILSVITLLITAYVSYKSVVDTTAKSQKSLNDVLKEGTKDATDSIAKLEVLYRTATNVNASTEERTRAVQKLKAEFPGYFGQIDDEIIKNGQASRSYHLLRDAIVASARAKAAQAELEKREGDRFQRDEAWKESYAAEHREILRLKKDLQDMEKTGNITGNRRLEMYTRIEGKEKALKRMEIDRYNAKISDRKADASYIKAISANQERSSLLNPATDEITNSNYLVPENKEKAAKVATAKKTAAQNAADEAQREYEALRKKILDSAENFDQEELELQAKLQDAKADLIANGYEKELAQIQAEESKKLADLEKEKHSEKEYAQLDSIIAKEKGNLKLKFEAIKAEWLKQDAAYSELQQLEIQKTNYKVLALQEKYIAESYKKADEAFQKKIDLLKRESNLTVANNDTVEKQKMFLAARGYSEDSLKKIRTWEQGRIAIEKEFQKKELTEKLEFLQRKVAEFNAQVALNPISLTEGQLEIIEEYRQKISELLAEITKLKNGESTDGPADFSSLKGIGGNTDILGLTTEQWSAMFKNTNDLEANILKVAAALQVAQRMFAEYSAFAQANEQAMVRKMEESSDRKQKKLKRELTEGYINQETYKKLTLQNEAELDLKKAEIEYKAAKRQRLMAISQVITSTALGIMNIWATQGINPIAAGILTGVVGALGAIQLMTIIKQPLPEVPGAEEGYYPTIRQQDGKLFNARRKRSQTGIYNEPTMLVGEGGASMPELVVSGKDLKRISPTIQRQYMNEIARVKGYEDGLYPKPGSSSGNDEVMLKMMQTIDEFRQVMQDIKDYGIEAKFAKTARNGKDLKETVKTYEKYENKSKH